MARVASARTRQFIFGVDEAITEGITPDRIALFLPDGTPINLTADPSKMKWMGDWAADVDYILNDVVRQDDKLFIAVVEDIPAGQPAPSTPNLDWELLFNLPVPASMVWQGEWNVITEYVQNDVVLWQNGLWIAPGDISAGTEPGNAAQDDPFINLTPGSSAGDVRGNWFRQSYRFNSTSPQVCVIGSGPGQRRVHPDYLGSNQMAFPFLLDSNGGSLNGVVITVTPGTPAVAPTPGWPDAMELNIYDSNENFQASLDIDWTTDEVNAKTPKSVVIDTGVTDLYAYVHYRGGVDGDFTLQVSDATNLVAAPVFGTEWDLLTEMMRWAGEWDVAEEYARGDVVSHEGALWVAPTAMDTFIEPGVSAEEPILVTMALLGGNPQRIKRYGTPGDHWKGYGTTSGGGSHRYFDLATSGGVLLSPNISFAGWKGDGTFYQSNTSAIKYLPPGRYIYGLSDHAGPVSIVLSEGATFEPPAPEWELLVDAQDPGFKGNWSVADEYPAGSIVRFNNKLYGTSEYVAAGGMDPDDVSGANFGAPIKGIQARDVDKLAQLVPHTFDFADAVLDNQGTPEYGLAAALDFLAGWSDVGIRVQNNTNKTIQLFIDDAATGGAGTAAGSVAAGVDDVLDVNVDSWAGTSGEYVLLINDFNGGARPVGTVTLTVLSGNDLVPPPATNPWTQLVDDLPDLDPGFELVVKTADEIVNNSVAMQDDDHLVFQAEANSVYKVELHLIGSSLTAAPDLQVELSVPAGATYGILRGPAAGAGVGSGSGTTAAQQLGIGAGNVEQYLVVYGLVRIGATAGPVRVRWAQNTLTAEDTKLLSGTHMLVRKLI